MEIFGSTQSKKSRRVSPSPEKGPTSDKRAAGARFLFFVSCFLQNTEKRFYSRWRFFIRSYLSCTAEHVDHFSSSHPRSLRIFVCINIKFSLDEPIRRVMQTSCSIAIPSLLCLVSQSKLRYAFHPQLMSCSPSQDSNYELCERTVLLLDSFIISMWCPFGEIPQ